MEDSGDYQAKGECRASAGLSYGRASGSAGNLKV